ncbi:hypothetical protein BJV74DRAFT_911069 [Russula compacta]|nr:hypothetical protein BJV74DRAFT_911069 [Russula compacta]
MSSTNSSSIPSDIAQFTAPMLFGCLVNWMLYGVICVQTYVYTYNFPDDRRFLKVLAYFLFLLDTAQTALTGVDVYRAFAAGFGDMDRLRSGGFSPIDGATMIAPLSLIVQGFYCYRIWRLNNRLFWFCVIIAIVRELPSVEQLISMLTIASMKLSLTQAIATAWCGINVSDTQFYFPGSQLTLGSDSYR